MADHFTDIEGALRDYLRAQLPDTNVWLFEPPSGSPTFPMIVITGRIGGAPDSYVPLENPRVSFSVWGSKGGTGRRQAHTVTGRLVDVLLGLDNASLDATTFGYGATVDSTTWAPDRSDPNNVLPRYIVDATLMVRTIAA